MVVALYIYSGKQTEREREKKNVSKQIDRGEMERKMRSASSCLLGPHRLETRRVLRISFLLLLIHAAFI
jgi:hypothetical protein